MNTAELIAKLSKPYWTPVDPNTVFHNLTPEHIGQLNIMWVLTGRRKLTTGFFDNKLDAWAVAGAICNEKIDGSYVRDYATIYTEEEFKEIVKKHNSLFAKHAPKILQKFKVPQ